VVVLIGLVLALVVVCLARGREPAAARQIYRSAILGWAGLWLTLPLPIGISVTLLVLLIPSFGLGLGIDVPAVTPIFDFEQRFFLANPLLAFLLYYSLFLAVPILTWIVALRRLPR